MARHRKPSTKPRERHGMSRSPEYKAWVGMIERCENPNQVGYRNYGGRGIRVCDRWRASFLAFLRDMGPKPTPKHSLDRLNPNGHYCPANCRWATTEQQGWNKRGCFKAEHFHRGEHRPIEEIARIEGVDYLALYAYLKRGLGLPAALSSLQTPDAGS